MPSPAMYQINRLLSPETVRVNFPGHTKEEVIRQMVGLLAGSPHLEDIEAVYQAVQERESLMSTGVGQGLGLPHGKTDAVTTTLAAFAVTAEPVEFDAIDGAPVRLVFLLVGPETEQTVHVKLLSQISRLMSNKALREKLLVAPSTEAVLDLFEEAERHVSAPS